MEIDNENSIDKTIKNVNDILKEVPIYQDAIQPFAKETGKALETIGKTVNAALLPIKGLIWGIEKIENFITTSVSERLIKIPIENIQSPDPSVAGPLLESLRYTGHNNNLSEMYANLLASSMDSETAKNAHPGFVDIIRNISSDEAKILSYLFKNNFIPIIDIRNESKIDGSGVILVEMISTIGDYSSCDHKDLIPAYFINLNRLGLIRYDKGSYLASIEAYKEILEDENVIKIINSIDKLSEDKHSKVVKYYAEITPLGQQFGDACILDKRN